MVTFNCSADGNPPVDTYQLLENNTLVSDGSKRLGTWSRNMSSGGVFIYKCMANNSAGTAYSMSLNVIVNGEQMIQLMVVNPTKYKRAFPECTAFFLSFCDLFRKMK